MTAPKKETLEEEDRRYFRAAQRELHAAFVAADAVRDFMLLIILVMLLVVLVLVMMIMSVVVVVVTKY